MEIAAPKSGPSFGEPSIIEDPEGRDNDTLAHLHRSRQRRRTSQHKSLIAAGVTAPIILVVYIGYCLVIGVTTQIEHFQRQLAAGHDDRSAYPSPAGVGQGMVSGTTIQPGDEKSFGVNNNSE